MKKKRWRYVSFALFVLIMLLTYLYTENPQKSKYIYLFQARVNFWLGRIPRPLIDPPYPYTGAWKSWYPDGRGNAITYENSKSKGKVTNWDKEGNIYRITVSDTPCHLDKEWDNGKFLSEGIVYNDKNWYGSFVIERKDEFTPKDKLSYYLDYKEATKEEYEKWEKESGGLEKLLKEHPEILR